MNKYFIKILIDTFIDNYNKNKEEFINEIIDKYHIIMPMESPVINPEFKCAKMDIRFTEETRNIFELMLKSKTEELEKGEDNDIR